MNCSQLPAPLTRSRDKSHLSLNDIQAIVPTIPLTSMASGFSRLLSDAWFIPQECVYARHNQLNSEQALTVRESLESQRKRYVTGITGPAEVSVLGRLRQEESGHSAESDKLVPVIVKTYFPCP
ncbi:hypothetical protein BDZ89DRAFT_1073277 [Hymenopellis radicata]|nr:hypothetical protein BDZ89DRAFT_1073277 [Hymenopellis radicata]